MQRKRDGLVPIGEAFGDLGGPVKEIRESSPQALHHFTQADQVNQLVGASEADPDRGFMARMMALCSLPRTNPGNRHRYVRRNGPYTLIMYSSGETKLPFGNFPAPDPGLGVYGSGTDPKPRARSRPLAGKVHAGPWASTPPADETQTKLRNQMKRLFGCTVQLTYKDANVERFVNSPIAESGEYWWNPRRPDQPSLWDSKIELSEKFFNEIIQHPVPIDMNTLTALKRCSLGLDLYLWLTYRTFTLRSPLRLTWQQVYSQFGANPDNAHNKKTIQNFRRPGTPRVEEDQAGLAGPELHDGSGRADPACPQHRPSCRSIKAS